MLKFIFINLLSLFMSLFVILPVSAETSTMPLWYEEDAEDLLTAAQKSYLCSNWDTIMNYDTIFYYTDTDKLVYGNYAGLTNGFYYFNDCWTILSDGSADGKGYYLGFKDGNNVGAVYKSSGAFGLNFDNSNLLLQNCAVAPGVSLPSPSEPNFTFNTEQSDFIALNASPMVQGGSINYFRYDYYNIYAVYATAITETFGSSGEDMLIKYQHDSSGRYLIPVYDHSEIVLYGPNLTISSSGFTLHASHLNDINFTYAQSDGVIQRDVQRFDYRYVDLQAYNDRPWSDLPFSDSAINTGKVQYLGVQSTTRSGGTASRSLMLNINGLNYSTIFYFVVSDTYNDIQNAQYQSIINNNINNNFSNLDNVLQHGNSISQNAQSGLDSSNNTLESTINEYNQLDHQANQDLINNLNNINVEQFELTGIAKLTNASEFVRAQFDNLTNNNPIGISIGFGLVVGLALLLLARRV